MLAASSLSAEVAAIQEAAAEEVMLAAEEVMLAAEEEAAAEEDVEAVEAAEVAEVAAKAFGLESVTPHLQTCVVYS